VTALFAKAMIVGFAVSIPVGPVGLLCIRRAVIHGAREGFVGGLGAALADSLWAALAVYGITAISAPLMRHEDLFQVVGGLVLIALGLRAFAPLPHEAHTRREGLAGLLSTSFFLTISNPATLVAMAAVLAVVGLAEPHMHGAPPGAVVLGVFVGALGWWALLSVAAARLGESLSPHRLQRLNRGLGAGLAGIGVVALGLGVAEFWIH